MYFFYNNYLTLFTIYQFLLVLVGYNADKPSNHGHPETFITLLRQNWYKKSFKKVKFFSQKRSKPCDLPQICDEKIRRMKKSGI